MQENTWETVGITLIKKAIGYCKRVMSDEILDDLKYLTTAHALWEKLRTAHEINTPVNQVHLMRQLVVNPLDELKIFAEHIGVFAYTFQLQEPDLFLFSLCF